MACACVIVLPHWVREIFGSRIKTDAFDLQDLALLRTQGLELRTTLLAACSAVVLRRAVALVVPVSYTLTLVHNQNFIKEGATTRVSL